MIESDSSSEQGARDVYRRAPVEERRSSHPEPARVRAPARLDVVGRDVSPLLRGRIAGFGGRIDETTRSGVLATVEGVAVAASVVAWARPLNLPDAGPHTRGVVRAYVAPGTARLRVTRRQLFSLRTWASSVGLLKEGFPDPAMNAAFVVTGDEGAAVATLSDEACQALLAMRVILTDLEIDGGVVELGWITSGFDEHTVLPSAVLVAVLEIARRAA